MPKRVVFLVVSLSLATGFLGYRLGSTPVTLANPRPTPQDASTAELPVAALPTAPAEWTFTSMPSQGTAPSIVIPAGGSGVKRVVDCVSINDIHVGSTSGSFDQVLLENGVAGSAKLMRWDLGIPAANSGGASIQVCGLNIVGSANTAMTLRFGSVNGGSISASVDLVGHDAM
jgi:hypothetical protein